MRKRTKAHRARCAYIHIGTPKAGSTSLQETLAGARRPLIGQGALYPESLGSIAHNRLAAAMGPVWRRDALRKSQDIPGPRSVLRLRADLHAALRREMDEARPETLLISSEHLYVQSSTLGEIKRLKRFVSAFAEEIRVVVYLRRQDQAIYSSWLHALRVGKTRDFTAPSVIRRRDRHDYAARLRLWSRVFGREAVTPRAFQRGALIGDDPARDYLEFAGLERPPGPSRWANRALDGVRADFMRRINKMTPRQDLSAGEPTFRGDLDLAIDAAPPLGETPRIARRDAAAILDLYSRSNERLAREWNDGEPFFDLALDKEAPDVPPLEVDDVIAIAAHLWAHKQKREDRLRSRVRALEEERSLGAAAAKAVGRFSAPTHVARQGAPT